MNRIVIAVVAAGVAGTIANAIAAGLFLGSDRFDLMLVPGRHVVAVLSAIALPLALLALTPPVSHVSAIVALIVIPSLQAKLVFGAGAPWGIVLSLNAVYAVAAWAVYLLLVQRVSTD